MILNIGFKNFRAFKDRINFSLIAEAYKSKSENVFTQSIGNGNSIQLLKSAAIYGANASGKSTLFRGLFEIINLVVNEKQKVNSNITAYQPFEFSEESQNKPVEFSIDFIYNNTKLNYFLVFNRRNILEEVLVSFQNKKKILFERSNYEKENQIKHIGFIGSKSNNRRIELFHNQTILSKFGIDIPDELISGIFDYFQNILIVNATNHQMLSHFDLKIREKADKDLSFRNKINSLIQHADIGINEISIENRNYKDYDFPKNLSKDLLKNVIHELKYQLTSYHNFYRDNELLHEEGKLSFSEESHGTQTLFTLGGILLLAIEKGIPIFVDELDKSLHTHLSKLLISLFLNSEINTLNSQLIFTTHDTNLIDRSLFRRDQIWFTEKDEKGVTELFSLHDFTDVREDTPFERWYLAGKFGALPNIKSLINF